MTAARPRFRDILFLCLVLLCTWSNPSQAQPNLESRLDSLPVIDEIDTATQAPIHQFPTNVSAVKTLLGKPSRVLEAGDSPRVMGWVIGKGKGLRPGAAYLLEVEYPDDVPRTIFIANRGADLLRGFSTGSATGDARQQYVQPSIESLNYPQSKKWRTYRTLFFLHDRFQGLYAQRDSKPGGRPFAPTDGFHVLIFQSKQLNDPRSEGAAVGKIRLREVPDLAAFEPKIEYPPDDLPRRRIFYREEMADETVSAREPNDRGVADPLNWLEYKAKINRVLGINTFAKDLMEFGFNQGWQSGDERWIVNAQPPNTDLWERALPMIARHGLDLMPYYEYKGGIGLKEAQPQSLGWQRRAEKLYHNLPNTRYTGVWWTEDHNADLTDPDTLADVRRVLDRTILAHKGEAKFAGAWFRVRDNHLPVSFSDAAVARFRRAFPKDPIVQATSRASLIASYEGDGKLYSRYINWWLQQRRAFFEQIAAYLSDGLGNDRTQVLFTPWMSEQIPMLRDSTTGDAGTPVQVTTDDPAWWDRFARGLPDSEWFRWALSPTAWDTVVSRNDYGLSLTYQDKISPAPERNEQRHSAPVADPEHYRDSSRVMLTFPIGRLFTVARAELIDGYRTNAGLTVVRHYTLNEDDHDRAKGPSHLPFDGQVGYASVDVDRAGPYVRLLEARAVAQADPTNLGYLCASSFSTGFPGEVQRFNQAFLSVPALPSRVVPNASNDPEVVVRAVSTPHHGTYFYVVNTSMTAKSGVTITLAGAKIRDLVLHQDLPTATIRLDLQPGELRSYLAR